jgi:hypothetical protein
MFETCAFNTSSEQWSWFIPLIIIIVLSFVMRRRRPMEKTPQDIASSLLMDVMGNQKILETFSTRKRPQKLRLGSWQRNHEKLDFLDESLRKNLANAFSMAEDFNLRIDSAKMYKSDSYLFGVNIDRLEEPLTKSREGLEAWLRANIEQAGPGAGRQGCLGGGLGGGGLFGG